MQLLYEYKNPALKVWRGFVSPEEIKVLVDITDARMAPSFVMNANGTGHVQDNIRTSHGAAFAPGENPLLAVLTQRAAEMTGSNPANFETMQVLRYTPGQEYRAHWDFFFPEHPSSVEALNRGGQRTGTLLIYLETPEEGGETVLPDAGITVHAVAGDALWFEYLTPSATTKTLHAGAPVRKGTKRVATLWRRECEFDSPWPDLRITDNFFTNEQCEQLIAYYESRSDREVGVDNAMRFMTPEHNAFIQPYVDQVAAWVHNRYGTRLRPETVVMGCMQPGSLMENHADNVRWDGTKHVPNHTPERVVTAVAMLDDGPGGSVVFGMNEGHPQYSKVIEQKRGRIYAHRCGPNYYHNVTRTMKQRHTLPIWFKI